VPQSTQHRDGKAGLVSPEMRSLKSISTSRDPLGEGGGVEGRERGLGTVATFLSPRKLGGL
jgi:hypothetical protein